MAWIGAAIGAGAGLIGNVMSQQGQAATNAMSMDEMLQQEAWQTQMSNTAMQRRVQDLKLAGLNPMLAVGGPGATVGGVGTPTLQNPMASFGNLGNQVTNAMQLGTQQSQIDLNKAQAESKHADAALATTQAQKAAGVDTDAQKQSILESQSRQALQGVQADAARAQAGLSSAQSAVAQATLPKIQAEIATMWSQRDLNSAKANVENLQSMLQDLDIQQRTAIMPSVIESAQYAARSAQLAIPEQYALADFFSSGLGSATPAVRQILQVALASISHVR